MAFTQEAETDTVGRVHFKMSEIGAAEEGILLGRGAGQDARRLLEREIEVHRNTDDPVVIDFSGIRAATVPFVEGFFVPLLSSWLTGFYDNHPLLVTGTNDDVGESLEAVMRLHGLAILTRGEFRNGLLGGDPSMRDAMARAVALERFSAADLARELGISQQAANNRLKELLRRGAVTRVRVTPEGGGREFEYHVPLDD